MDTTASTARPTTADTRRPLRVLVAPSGFKESLDAAAVAAAMAAGVRTVDPAAEVRELPLVDGGEGFAEAVVAATGGTQRSVLVHGPVGQAVRAPVGLLGGDGPRTAVIDLASAAGLRLVPADRRDPMRTSSRGFGELLRAALDTDPVRILIGCGDSGINDGGVGMAAALGVRFLDADGAELEPVAAELHRLAAVDTSGLDPRLRSVEVEAACNPYNVLCGPQGVARVFGPQKGATPAQVEQLAAAMDVYARVLRRDVGVEVATVPGGGASGGLGAGLLAFCGAVLRPRFDVVFDHIDVDGALEDVDLVLTGEGSLDGQTPRGKVPAEVARRAADRGVPTIAIAGTLGEGVEANLATGLRAWCSVVAGPSTLAEAMASASRLVTDATAQVVRMVLLGRSLAEPAALAAAA
jgi:glycerate 2-kinase